MKMPPHEGEIQPTKIKPNPRNNATMFQIFQNVQYNVVQHKKYVKEMKKLYKKLDEETFRESFKNALHYLFTFGDTSANVDRVVTFVATFCTSLDDEEEFLLFICDVIFNCQCVSGQSVRYRASQLLAALLAALGDDASLDDDLCDKLLASQDAPPAKKKENLTTRLKRHETRVNALKKGNTLLTANVDRIKDDVLNQREKSMALQKELDSLITDLE